MKFIKGAGNLRPILGTQIVFWPLTLLPGLYVCTAPKHIAPNLNAFHSDAQYDGQKHQSNTHAPAALSLSPNTQCSILVTLHSGPQK